MAAIAKDGSSESSSESKDSESPSGTEEDTGETQTEDTVDEQFNGVRLKVKVWSFSYRKGVPVRMDKVWNLRDLPNPAENRRLSKTATGLSKKLRENLLAVPSVAARLASAENEAADLLLACIDRLPPDTPSLTVRLAFGCDRGMHRSVAFAETLARSAALASPPDPPRPFRVISITIRHRDLLSVPTSHHHHPHRDHRRH